MGGTRSIATGRAAIGRLSAIVFAIPLLAGWQEGDTKIHYTYYPVSGKNHAEIASSVRRFAPKAGRAYGIGFLHFDPRYDMRMKDGKCRVVSTRTKLTIKLKLPEWKGPDDAPRSAVRLGKHFAKSIRRHEMDHVKIAERYARKMSRDLARLKPAEDCWKLGAKARDLLKQINAQHMASQRAYDNRTRRQLKRLL